MLTPVRVSYFITHYYITVIKQIFKYGLCVHSACTINLRSGGTTVPILSVNLVFACNCTAYRLKKPCFCVFRQELLIVLDIYPAYTDTGRNISCL